MIAPAVIPTGIPKPYPIPRNASPIVPMVVQELPVEIDIIAHKISVEGKNHDGENILSP